MYSRSEMLSDMQRRLAYQMSDLESGIDYSREPSRHKRVAVSFLFITLNCLFFSWSIVGLFSTSTLLLWLIVVSGWILSLTLHEYCHAVTAYWGGDNSIIDKGYLSLNFLLYMDPIMSLLLPILLLVFGGVALPGGSVLIQTSLLRSAKWEALSSLAGPVGNLIFAVLLRLILLAISVISRLTTGVDRTYTGSTGQAWTVSIALQGLAIFLNLLPLPPLDGWGIVSPFLSANCFLKRWINKSVWNGRTASIVTFGIIYLSSTTSVLWTLGLQPIKTLLFLDANQLATGFSTFFGAFHT